MRQQTLSGEAASDLDSIWPRRVATDDVRNWLGDEADDLVASLVTREVSRPIWDLVDRGGKRWRALVAELAWRAAGGQGRVPAVVAEVPELLHNASLVVDDIEDGATERRGGPSAHVAHGLPVALNAANAAYFRAMAVLRGALDDATRLRALDMLAEELFAAHLGQALDLSLGAAARLGVEVAEPHYLALARAKTGALVRIAARLGAICAGAPAAIESTLARWAGEVGIAYQIRDDADDIGSSEEDLEACRLGHPLLLALASANAEDAAILRRHLGDPEPGAAVRERRRRVLDRLSVVERSRCAARAAAERACAELEALPPGEAREALAALTRRLAGD